MTGGARGEGNFGGEGGRGRLGRPWAQSGGGAVGPAGMAHGGGGKGGRGAAGPKWGKRERERKRKGFPFFISIFLYKCFHTFKQPKNVWFGMMQQIKEINSRVYYYHIT
jgi:hypothetical protein